MENQIEEIIFDLQELKIEPKFFADEIGQVGGPCSAKNIKYKRGKRYLNDMAYRGIINTNK